jgi:stage V sporulation protein D (sporulation-specific penicillin-binding protein)
MDIATRLGKDKFYDYIYKFGFGQTTNVGLTGDTSGIVRHVKYIRTVDIARIGFGQAIAVTPIQLATAACAAINGGNLMQPHIVKEIVSQEGEVIEQIKPSIVRRVITEETSAIVRTLLQGVVREGSGKNAYIPGYRVGGKTGTAQKYENNHIAQGKLVASFIGFAPADDPQVVVLILVDEPKVNVIFGSTVAAPFVRDVLFDTLKHYNVEPKYDETEKNLRLSVEIPDVRGLSLDAAAKELKAAGFKSQEDGGGTVVNQVPQPGAKVPEGTIVLLYMSDLVKDENTDEDAGAMIEVPDVLGKLAADAYEVLSDNGLEIKSVGDPKGAAVMQKPGAGEKVAFGSTITVEFELKPK